MRTKNANTAKKNGRSSQPAKNNNSSARASAGRASGNDTAEMNSGENSSNPEENNSNSPFEQLFTTMLKETYYMEKQLVEALGKMSGAATTEVLQSAFEDHEYVTQKHVRRLEKVFSLLGMPAEEQQCAVTDALIQSTEKVIDATKENTMTRDAGLIICAQKAEHHEIATYGSLVQVALTLGYAEAASILEKTLWEEEDTDSLLTEIAESDINPMADLHDEPQEQETANAAVTA